MHRDFESLLGQYNLEAPPLDLNDDLYRWLDAADKELSVEFVSNLPMRHDDLERLKAQLGTIHSEMDYYYARSTPWRYGIEDYFDAVNQIEAECISILRRSGLSEKEAKSRISQQSPLWPVHIYHKGPTAVAFSDSTGQLCVLEASRYGGLGFGRPLAMGLKNFLVLRVILQLSWLESDGETFALDSTVLALGEWPMNSQPDHVLIDCYNLTT